MTRRRDALMRSREGLMRTIADVKRQLADAYVQASHPVAEARRDPAMAGWNRRGDWRWPCARRERRCLEPFARHAPPNHQGRAAVRILRWVTSLPRAFPFACNAAWAGAWRVAASGRLQSSSPPAMAAATQRERCATIAAFASRARA